jgi:hypothetical protein
VGDATHVKFQGNSLYCAHCGARFKLPLPMPIYLVSAVTTAFSDEHAECHARPEVAERDRRELETSFANPHAWIAGPDTGMSSKTIWCVMMGAYCREPYTPADPSDFGRCYRLLKAFPEWRERMPEVAVKHPEWGPLVREWAALTALYEEELPKDRAPKLYARMQELNEEGRTVRK